jgi:DNA processing protein
MNSEPEPEFRKITDQDDDYPKSLRELRDRPQVLYVKGRWPLPQEGLVGIVGTRRASAYGMQAAERFTSDLVQRGLVTVSGLAAGIDTCVHQETLKRGGWTVAVLGHGFDYQYPKENKALFEDIAKRGTLVTEFSHDTRPEARLFPQRNRIISGLSESVLVVEAGHRSGALITARYAAEQGRDVFALPGSIFSSQSIGCHRLIKEGAKLVESAEEILEEYGFIVGQSLPSSSPAVVSRNDDNLTSSEKELVTLFSSIPLSVDELVELSGLPVDRLAEVLLSLEIKGRIQSIPGQRYVAYN